MMQSGSDEGETRAELVPASGPGSVREWAEQLVAQARADGIALTGEGGLLTDLMRHVLQTGLEVEMAEHLGYGPHERAGRGSGNSRNGAYDKTVVTEIGEVPLRVPRDRAGTFEPAVVPKYQRRLDGLSGNVISLYAKGLTTGEIQQHLLEIYGTEISRDTISRITDEIVEEMTVWQNRPLDPLYAVLVIDCLMIKVRDAQVANRPVYVAIGVNLDGERDVLGMWLGPTGGEGAKQWATMLTELRNRGLKDALIVCCDGLKGLPDSIRTTWPEATVQTCVVHMVRNSLRYASRQHWARITAAMREIYTAPTVQAAEARFAEFAEDWEAVYPAMIQTWRSNWEEFVPFLEFPVELRKLVYTTNAIESLNARLRRGVRNRGHFPNENAAMKVLFLVATQRRKNRQDMTGKTAGWKTILNTLTVHYGERIQASTTN
jgi:transposase-like protein